MRQPFTEDRLTSLLRASPFSTRAEILTFDREISTFQLRFATRFSADAFCHWLSEDDELSSSLAVIANSSKILLNQDSEPFIPMPTDDDEGAENLSEPQMDEEGK